MLSYSKYTKDFFLNAFGCSVSHVKKIVIVENVSNEFQSEYNFNKRVHKTHSVDHLNSATYICTDIIIIRCIVFSKQFKYYGLT